MKMDKYKRNTLFLWMGFVIATAVIYLGITSCYLNENKQRAEQEWDNKLHLSEELTVEEQELTKEAVPVSVGTYVENINNIDIRQCTYSVIFQVFFAWEDGVDFEGKPFNDMQDKFSIYDGNITDIKTISNYVTSDGIRIQKLRVHASVSNVFETTRFPLSSYQLRLYLIPDYTIEKLLLIPERENCFMNEGLVIPGFELERMDTNIFYFRNNPKIAYAGKNVEEDTLTYSEMLVTAEFNRSSWGLYLKCIIALVGTSVWAFLMLYTCIYHHVNSLGMLPAVLFGTVSNILVGANLIPDAMDTGLLEFINIWGVYTIIIISIIIMQINHIRNNKEEVEFAKFFGKCMLILILLTTIVGHIILPLSAYKFS